MSLVDKDLLFVSKPLRYIGGELNSYSKKNFDIHLCLAFPDVYEVGMSHYGFKLLYERLNSIKEIYCERFFMPWIDAIKRFDKDIFISLETKTPLKQFDLIGFSLQYELSYTNMLFSLKKAGIPIKSIERGKDVPIIIAGGPCVVNPAPISDFVDVFFVGEMEEELEKVIYEFSKHSSLSRREKLEFFNKFDFTYVPLIDEKKHVKRKIYSDFSFNGFCEKTLVPNFSVVQDRVSLEISRGCTRGCRFCQAGFVYRPSRERNKSDLILNAKKQITSTGYFEVSLLSLSAADYSKLEDLMIELNDALSKKNVSISLPSVRADQIKSFIFRELTKVRKSGFTIAPEAGSERMRNIINKNLSEEEIIEAVVLAADGGFKHAKLYFMIGLPFETMDDVKEIAELVKKIKKKVPRKFDITVSVSNFVPKPFTPFQWIGQDYVDKLIEKQNILKELFHKYRIKYRFHDVHQSVLEACFSKGGKELGRVLLYAVNESLIFDGWSEFFSFEKWKELFFKNKIDIYEYASKSFHFNEALPWSNIDVGIRQEYLVEEFEKSKKEATTGDCKWEKCTNCGVCDFKSIKNTYSDDKHVRVIEQDDFEFIKYKVVFEKKEKGVFFSALDLVRHFQHVFFQVGINLNFTKGFNPQPKINYVFPLPLGIDGENEILLFEGSRIEDIESFKKEVNSLLMDGIKIKNVIEDTGERFDDCIAVYELDEKSFTFLINMVRSDKGYYEKLSKKGKKKNVYLKNFLINSENNLVYLRISNLGGVNLLEFFKFWDYNISKLEIRRKEIYPNKNKLGEAYV